VFAEPVLVHDHRAALLERADVGDQSGGVHRHQHVRVVPRREDVARGEVDLEGRDAVRRARGGPNLGGEIRQRGEVVAHDRRRVREPATGELHPIARVAGEADDHAIELLECFLLHQVCSARV
jgi:hypothetical protein